MKMSQSQSSPARAIGVTAAIAVISAITGACVFWLMDMDDTAAAERAEILRVQSRSLECLHDLAREVDLLHSLRVEAPARVVEEAVRDGVEAKLDEVSDRLLERLAILTPPETDAGAAAPVPRDDLEIESTIDLCRRDIFAATESHLCWSPRSVYAEFGKPDRQECRDGELRWYYRSKSDTGDWLCCKFASGVVSYFGMADDPTVRR